MMYQLPEKLKNLTAYEPNSGDYTIRLDANESFLPLSKEIKDEIKKAMDGLEFHRYPDPDSKQVIKAFAHFFELDENLVVAGNGSDELISIILANFATYQDSILVTSPDFSMYEFYGKQSGLHVEKLEKTEDFSIDQMIKVAKEKQCKIVLLSNPCNPSSLCIQKDEIKKLAQSLDCLVVIDEAYMDFSDESIIKETNQFDNVIVLKTCSKAFGLAAIRLGFAISNPKLTNCLKMVKSPYNVNLLTQTVGEIVLSKKEYLTQCIEEMKKETKFLYEELKKLENQYPTILKINPTSTNFIFLWCQTKERAKSCMERMKKEKIAIRLMGDYIRITAGNRAENEVVLTVMKQWLMEGENEKL